MSLAAVLGRLLGENVKDFDGPVQALGARDPLVCQFSTFPVFNSHFISFISRMSAVSISGLTHYF